MVNKQGLVITAAVTSLDLHDIARAAKTYGARSFYVVTPLADQVTLVKRLLAHWTEGAGAAYNPQRRKALELIRIRATLDEAIAEIRAGNGSAPHTIATSARSRPGAIGFGALRRMLTDGRPHLLLLGTGWGLAPELIDAADCTLEPLQGATDYNHLSVRSAAAIILDRLTG